MLNPGFLKPLGRLILPLLALAWLAVAGRGADKPLRPNGTTEHGYRAMSSPHEGPWTVAVTNHEAVRPGEHPRLLFRRADVPALRAKAQTPEGRAILGRLRQLLDGGTGESMTTRFNRADRAYAERQDPLPPGTYTIGHAAGYGLLYQLTGERKYAEFGRECFERALAGARDRDDRYSFRRPGGALRAGPTLGWMAVGYDLCYDGWDVATRERLGRALFEYRETSDEKNPKNELSLDLLARGTMPPYSNHFSMQTGGAALVLLAVQGETWADATRVTAGLAAVEKNLVRNLEEGFGDGGFFAEGDGTGSMAAQIVYLTALQAWKNVRGQDFAASPRPNARMLALKWQYQTVYREGRPEVWPIRGGYPHNVWSREGLSGAAYFAAGFSIVPAAERAALKWNYERFLASADARAGQPYDTASLYPHFAVSAFVNWPVELPARDPATVLPRCYRDAVSGFYCWRDQWRNEDDTVITVLTNETRGYMGAKADAALMINSGGQHRSWGRVVEGPVRGWMASPLGETSVLTLTDGTCFGVDFTGESGAGILLATTGPATGTTVRLGDVALTLHFPTAERVPDVRVENGAAVVGRQKISVENGQIKFGRPGR